MLHFFVCAKHYMRYKNPFLEMQKDDTTVKFHFSTGHFLPGIVYLKGEHLSAFDPYREITEEG